MSELSFQETINGNVPVLVDFYATWCAPCQMMGPILQEVKNRMGDKVKIIKIDVDKNPHAAQDFRIQGVPTLIIFKNGEIKWRQSGVVPPDTLIEVLNKYSIN